MSDIELVIRISEEKYKDIQGRDWKNGKKWFSEEWQAIHNGTPLPKGHGDLVDRDKINGRFYSIWKELESYSNQPSWKKLLDKWSMCMDDAPTIIEADKESEDIGDYPDTISNQFDNMTGSMNI